MKRVVYSPKINVFIQADDGVYDLSPYVTECSVNRKVNAVSSASVSFRNPDKRFTNRKGGPTFHPMDPIVITMSRLPNRPVQVFTGYCDSTPYFQLKPGVATITASCTLKKLLHTYWDPGLPFVEKILSQRGWTTYPNGSGIALENAQAATQNLGNSDNDNGRRADRNQNNERSPVTDGSIGALLFDVLLYIGNWHPDTIYIENIPKTLYETAESLLGDINESNKKAMKEFRELMKQIIGEGGSYGNGSPLGNAGGAGPEPFAKVTPVDVGRAMLTAGFPNDVDTIAAGIQVVHVESDFGKFGGWDSLNGAGAVGYWQFQISPSDGSWSGHDISLKDACTLVPATKFAKTLWSGGRGTEGFSTHWYTYWHGGAEAPSTTLYAEQARNAISLGRFTKEPNSSGAGQPGSNTG